MENQKKNEKKLKQPKYILSFKDVNFQKPIKRHLEFLTLPCSKSKNHTCKKIFK